MVTKMKNEKEKDLIIENRFHKQLIGPKGENIQKIRDDFSSVQISFPDLGVKSDIVKLRGPKDDVESCSKTLTKMYKDLLESNYQVNFLRQNKLPSTTYRLSAPPPYRTPANNCMIYVFPFSAEIAHF